MTEDILKQIRKEYFTKKGEIEKLKEKRDRLKALEKCSEVQEYLNLLGCISLINDNQNEIVHIESIFTKANILIIFMCMLELLKGQVMVIS